jgi:drug/metabolite transporter (DMT)-like permease
MSVAGAMTVISNGRIADLGSYHIGTGELLIAGCVLSWVAYSLIGKSVMAQLSPLASVTYSAFVGTALLFPLAMTNGLGRDILGYAVQDWINLFYLGFFGTVLGFSWYYQGIERIGPMKASVFINFVPVSAIVLAALILEEQMTVSILLGTLLVISGVCLTNASAVFRRSFRSLLLRIRQLG